MLMRCAAPVIRKTRESSGAVLVLVALVLPAMIGVGGLIADVGNWYAHRRHLQVMADAGALAGAGKFRIPCTPAPIVEAATDYSSVQMEGGGPVPSPSHNPQIGSTAAAQLHGRINSKTYFNQGVPNDDTIVADPCTAKMIDVKLTETDLPWFLKLAQVDFINAHARLEIKKKLTAHNSLPVGVPEVGPLKAKALFVDEANGTVVASTDIVKVGTSDGLAIWSNSAVPVAVPIEVSKIGVRIVLSGGSSTQCGDPLVECYGAGTSTAIVAGDPGLAHIRGYASTPAGTATDPKVRQATLSSVSCEEDAYFTARVTAGSCSAGITAVIDGLPDTATVFAKRANGANTKVPLTFTRRRVDGLDRHPDRHGRRGGRHQPLLRLGQRHAHRKRSAAGVRGRREPLGLRPDQAAAALRGRRLGRELLPALRRVHARPHRQGRAQAGTAARPERRRPDHLAEGGGRRQPEPGTGLRPRAVEPPR